jgi:hypothetical protein
VFKCTNVSRPAGLKSQVALRSSLLSHRIVGCCSVAAAFWYSEMGQGQEHIGQGCCRLSYSRCLGTCKTTVTKQQMMFEARGNRVEHSGLDLIRSNPIFENQKRRPMA